MNTEDTDRIRQLLETGRDLSSHLLEAIGAYDKRVGRVNIADSIVAMTMVQWSLVSTGHISRAEAEALVKSIMSALDAGQNLVEAQKPKAG